MTRKAACRFILLMKIHKGCKLLMDKKQINRKEILQFIFFAYTIPLLCVILMEWVPICQNGALNFILYGIEGMSPTLAAVIVVLITSRANKKKQKALQNDNCYENITLLSFLKDKYIKNLSASSCLIGFFLPAIILTIAKLLTMVIWDSNHFIVLPSMKKSIVILFALVTEELGWRGYLKQRIESLVGLMFAPLVLGIIWAIWHYHFFLSSSMDVPIFAFAFGCIAESYGYALLLMKSKGNVIPASLWHFSGNLFFNLYLLNPNWNNNNSGPYIITNSLYAIFIVIYIIAVRRTYRNGQKGID